MTFKEKFFALVEHHQRILITAHHSPDDDAIGSSLALSWFLRDAFPHKTVRIVISGEPNLRYKNFVGFSAVQFVSELTDVLSDFDLFIFLDGGQFHRFSIGRFETLRRNAHPGICIDHHQTPSDEFDLTLIEPRRTSTAEIICRLFFAEGRPPKEAAEALLLGILGDTGTFRYVEPDQSEIFLIAKSLVEATGESIQAFQSRYQSIPANILPLLQYLLGNARLHHLPGWPPFQTSFLPRTVIEEKSYSDEDIGAAVHIYMPPYLTAIENHPWGFVLGPDQNGDVSVSFRSSPAGPSVRRIAEEMGIGGGHDRSSGGTFRAPADGKLEPEDCLKRILGWLNAHAD